MHYFDGDILKTTGFGSPKRLLSTIIISKPRRNTHCVSDNQRPKARNNKKIMQSVYLTRTLNEAVSLVRLDDTVIVHTPGRIVFTR